MKSSRTKIAASVATATTLALLATGCASGSGGESEGEIELTITTFGTFGYDDLYAEYEAANPGIKIVANNIDTGGNARTDAFTKLAAGSGLSDVVAVEEGWLGSIMEVSDQFVDLREYGIEDRAGDWVDWKYEQATDPDGRVIGYGTDIGPEGLCYNRTAFEAAGLPSDREAVAELLGGADSTWDDYFTVGKQYQSTTGKAWYDHSGFVWNAMVNQLPEGYYTSDGELNVEGNADLEERWGWITDGAASGLSAAQTAWDWNGGKSFVDGTFATFVCPGWMLGVVQGQVEAGGGDTANSGWDFADVFPGGPANWGGAFLSVPTQSKHPEEAAALASWLTEPEQQIAQFEAAGTFPSTIAAEEDLAAKGEPNAFFNDAPVGAILAKRAEGVVAQYKGPDDSLIQENVFGPVLQKVDRGEVDATAGWSEAIALLNDLVKN
ncbi:ABC transporter substrate-binding protein [Herbiconiux sp. L3-i23]|uniref:ABC transporter substrate-binding protein n=1 Tax=Herbiconiux sp. L3-i23 TaxID=2905871 RepID=UPI00205C0F83|nr:extracellular solute-binding protein [Herbiconiux sp. L3-i23]BDI21314.1 sugar ABC transporter substrate-binding protein [Herbiconiux sp. L3-i23]